MHFAHLQEPTEGHGQRIPQEVNKMEIAGTQDQRWRFTGTGANVVGSSRTDVAIGAIHHQAVVLDLVTRERQRHRGRCKDNDEIISLALQSIDLQAEIPAGDP
jgi:hypothetical protein